MTQPCDRKCYELISIQGAIEIICNCRMDVAPGSLTVWRLLKHAEEHLDAQIAEALADPLAAESQAVTA